MKSPRQSCFGFGLMAILIPGHSWADSTSWSLGSLIMPAAMALTLIGAALAIRHEWRRSRELSRQLEQSLREKGEKIAHLEAENAELRDLLEPALDPSEFESLEQKNRDLVANVSHELKTPLTAIRGYAETLEDGALERPKVARRFTVRILEQCQRLERLLEDLLILAQPQVDQPQDLERFNLVELLLSCLETLDSQTRKKELEIVVQPVTDTLVIHADFDQIERLFLNLLDNAIKYNRREGQIKIRVEQISGKDDGALAAIEIRDTGIGIPEEALERIFERFYRVDKGRAREQGGSGLGLSMVVQAARAHGGRVEVESELGRGSIFRVFLPVGEQ